MPELLLGAAALAVGYVIGRMRPGPRVLDWAEDAAGHRPTDPRYWLAVPLILGAVAWVWTIRPRRTAANRRAWREAQARSAYRSPPVGIPADAPATEETETR